MSPTSRCVVLVPVANSIDGECEDALREAEICYGENPRREPATNELAVSNATLLRLGL